MNFVKNNQDSKIKASLDLLDRIFNQPHVKYRVIGSILVTAINHKPHRKVNDIDILLDKSNLKEVLSKLRKENYQLINKKIVGLKWLEATHKTKLGFTLLMVGKFNNRYFSYQPFKNIELRISSNYLKPTEYSLFGNKFIGIPIRSVYEGIKVSSLNPKRSFDKTILIKAMGNKLPEGESINKAFKVFVFGTSIPFLYQIFSWVYNIYGGVRVAFGKKYEIWN